jgi:hypothetical protein
MKVQTAAAVVLNKTTIIEKTETLDEENRSVSYAIFTNEAVSNNVL